MQTPAPDGIVVDEVSEMPAGITDEQVAALLAKPKRSHKAKVKPPVGPLLAKVTHKGEVREMRGIVNKPPSEEPPVTPQWYVKEYVQREGDPTADPPIPHLGIRKTFGPFETSRAMIRQSTVFAELKDAYRKRRKGRHAARTEARLQARREAPLVTKAERRAIRDAEIREAATAQATALYGD